MAHNCNDNKCVQKDCTCKVKIGTDCVTYTGNDLPCSGIKKGTILTTLITQLDAFICAKFDSISTFFGLQNTGIGAKIYSGDTNTGLKKLRSIVSENPIVTVEENTDEIAIGINEDILGDIIKDNTLSYSGQNVGTGVDVYKDVSNTGIFSFRRIDSPDLLIQQQGDSVVIKNPETTIPTLIVNSLYVPTYLEYLEGFGKGRGTMSKPFTNTVVYTSPTVYNTIPNTAIQNALDAYVGTGTRLNPEKLGQRIVIQDNNSNYTFTGDLNYYNLNLIIQANIVSTIQDYVLNMDNPLYFDTLNALTIIDTAPDKQFKIEGLGLKNSGNSVSTSNFETGKILRLTNTGTIYSTYNGADALTRYLISADPESNINGTTGNSNAGNLCIQVYSRLYAQNQGIAKVGGKCTVDFNGTVQSGTLVGTPINVNLKAIHQTGGTVRFFNGLVSFSNGGGSNRLESFVFEPTNGFTPSFIARNTQFQGSATTWFSKKNNSNVALDITGSTTLYFSGSNLFDSPNMWNVNFKNNTFESINIDFTKADLTQGNTVSSVNTIGNQVIESLVKYASRIAAQAVLPPYSAFINTNGNPSPTNSDKWIRDITLPTV